jgi:DNA-binding CsgD family transcriptional regulator
MSGLVVDTSHLDRSSSIPALLAHAGEAPPGSCGFSIARLVMRRPMAEFGIELRHLSMSTQGLVKEGLESAIAFRRTTAPGLASRQPLSEHRRRTSGSEPSTDGLLEMFTRSELTVVGQVAEGRLNREITAQVEVSPETDTRYIARLMRKLGAPNRADATIRCLRPTANVNDNANSGSER